MAVPDLRQLLAMQRLTTTTTLPRSIALLKIALGCPCAVTALPVGPDGGHTVSSCGAWTVLHAAGSGGRALWSAVFGIYSR
jgi:hypothetical protein